MLAQIGLYASILPPAIVALLETSRTLSVDPVSIAAIMIDGKQDHSGQHQKQRLDPFLLRLFDI
jgi:hypothetical protein